MKHTRKIGLFALLAGASILPSFLVKDAALSAEAAIKGRTIYSYNSGLDGRAYSYDAGRGRSEQVSNGLFVRVGSYSGEDGSDRYYSHANGTGFIDLNDLTVNQALPEAPVVNLNLSESPNSGKTLVRWNID